MRESIQPLKFSKKANQRIIVGLRWDPQKLPFYLRWVTPKTKRHFDLDLTCYIFGTNGDFAGIVSGEEVVSRDASGAVYHSGDDKTGEYGHDDEQIAVELLRLPEDISHIVFVASCKSAHHFDKVYNPSIRIADAMTEEDQFSTRLDKDSTTSDAFIFVRVFRDEGGWMVENVSEFLDKSKIDNWPVHLQQKWSLA